MKVTHFELKSLHVSTSRHKTTFVGYIYSISFYNLQVVYVYVNNFE